MKQQQEKKENPEWFVGFCTAIGIPLLFFFARRKSVGTRLARQYQNFLYGIGFMAVWGALSKSEALLKLCIPIGILSIIQHWRKTEVHSYTIGQSVMPGNVKRGWMLCMILTMVAGFFLLEADKGLGSYLMVCALANLVLVSFIYDRTEHILQDQIDAQIAARDMVSRMQ